MGELKEVDWQAMLARLRKYAQETPPAQYDPARDLPTGSGNRIADCDAASGAARLTACGVFSAITTPRSKPSRHGAYRPNSATRSTPYAATPTRSTTTSVKEPACCCGGRWGR